MDEPRAAACSVEPRGKVAKRLRPHVVDDWRAAGLVLEALRYQLRLEALLRAVGDEFAGVRSDAEVRACADAVLADFDEARVTSHVLVLAHRRTRDCLRQQTCQVLARR